MPDYRTMFDNAHLGAWDLQGKDVTVVIERVTAGELTGEGGRKARKPIIKFAGKELTLAVNKTNAKTIAGLYGTDTREWVGKAITIYPTTTQMGGETKECIRVRPRVPQRREQPQRPGPSPETPHAPPADEPLEPGAMG